MREKYPEPIMVFENEFRSHWYLMKPRTPEPGDEAAVVWQRPLLKSAGMPRYFSNKESEIEGFQMIGSTDMIDFRLKYQFSASLVLAAAYFFIHRSPIRNDGVVAWHWIKKGLLYASMVVGLFAFFFFASLSIYLTMDGLGWIGT